MFRSIFADVLFFSWSHGLSACVGNCRSWKGEESRTCYSAADVSKTRDQKRFTILKVAADWHELMIPQRTMRPFIARVSEQLVHLADIPLPQSATLCMGLRWRIYYRQTNLQVAGCEVVRFNVVGIGICVSSGNDVVLTDAVVVSTQSLDEAAVLRMDADRQRQRTSVVIEYAAVRVSRHCSPWRSSDLHTISHAPWSMGHKVLATKLLSVTTLWNINLRKTNCNRKQIHRVAIKKTCRFYFFE